MKIENSGPNRISKLNTEGAYSAERSSRSNESSNLNGLSGRDKATLSDSARLLAKARLALDEISPERAEEIQQLREQVQSGNYQVPHEEIVKQLLARVRISE